MKVPVDCGADCADERDRAIPKNETRSSRFNRISIAPILPPNSAAEEITVVREPESLKIGSRWATLLEPVSPADTWSAAVQGLQHCSK